MAGGNEFKTRASLRQHIEALGIVPGDIVMVHAAISKIGPLLNGPDALIWALRDAVGRNGTVMSYADWDARYDDLLDDDGRVPDAWRAHIHPFEPQSSRAARDNGVLPEFMRTTPGALRSNSPGPSMVAIGAQAAALTADHPIDYGYGEGSPLARLVESGGKVLMIGAPYDTMTLLHHAEHLADIPGKHICRYEVPFAAEDGVEWRMVEEFDTSVPVVAGLDDDYFAEIVNAFVATGQGQTGKIGEAPTLVVPAAEIVSFAVNWLESRFA